MRLSKKEKKRYLIILLSGFVVLFLLFYFLGGFPPSFMKRGFFYVSQPLIFLKSNVTNFFESNSTVFKKKKELESENIFLKQKLNGLQVEEEFSRFFEEENLRLKELFYFNQKRDLLISSVLLRPGYGVYNSLVIDSGLDNGVKNGMLAIALDNVFLGHVFEVTSQISKVKMVSFPGEETNVFIGNKISAIAVGLGGENMEIVLPRDVDIEKGDIITTLGTAPLFLGAVEEVIKDPANPFQRIVFRLPVNIQELRYVFLVKDEK